MRRGELLGLHWRDVNLERKEITGFVSEEPDRTYLAETNTNRALRFLQAATCTYRIASAHAPARKC
jgi:integrase